MGLNRPLNKEKVINTLDFFERNEARMTLYEIQDFWLGKPEARLLRRAKQNDDLTERYSDEQLVDLLNSLIMDPHISGIRDFTRSTNILKPAAETRDFKYQNMGYTTLPDGTKQLKIIDSGYGIQPAFPQGRFVDPRY